MWAIALGDVRPGRPGPQSPEDAVQHAPVITQATPRTLLGAEAQSPTTRNLSDQNVPWQTLHHALESELCRNGDPTHTFMSASPSGIKVIIVG